MMMKLLIRSAFAVLILASVSLPHVAVSEPFKVARTAIPPSRGIPFTAVSQPGVGIWSLMYDTLTRIDNQGNVEPALAESWESISPTQWKFRLRPDVRFHNGEVFDASSVTASIELLKSEAGARFYTASEVQGITAVEVIDSLTVLIETEKPDPILHRRASLLWMLPPDALADRGVDSFAQEPIGSGPFQLEEWGAGTVHFRSFSDSWRAPVAIEVLTIFVMQDPVARMQALRSGQVDVAEQMSSDDVSQLKGEQFQTFTRTAPGVSGLAFRVIGNESSPVADQRVRQAMNLAVNREAIVNNLYQGEVLASGQGAVPGVNGHNPEVKPWPFDPARARALLEEAGFDFDRILKIQVATGIAGGDSLAFQFVAQNLEAIGMKVELRSIPYANWLTAFLTNQWDDIDAFSLTWDNSAYYDGIRAETYTGCLKAQPFFCAPETKPLLNAISVEMDPTRRTALLQDLMAMLHEIAPAIWLVTGAEFAAAGQNVDGIILTSRGIQYDLVSLKNED
ncbi:MAG: ABC transporter substrate-binding protein [Rhodospirillaceae bacterium]